MEEESTFCADPFSGEKWKSWCRLCAKFNAKCVNVISGRCQENGIEIRSKCDMDLPQVILDFFRIHIKEDDKLSQFICMECHDSVLKLIEFRERVGKVQQMYDDLQNLTDKSPSNLQSLLENYDLYKDELQLIQNDNQLAVEKIYVADLADTVIIIPSKFDIKNEKILTDHLEETIKRDEEKNGHLDPFGDEVRDYGNESHSPSEDGFSSGNEDISLSELKDIEIQKKGTKTKIKRFKRSEDTSLKSKHSCSICSQTFNRRSNFSVHMKRKHGLILCPQCPSSFKTKLNLKQHMKEHRRSFNCRHCEQTFDKKCLLSDHMKREHKEHTEQKERKTKPSFVCETCGEALRTPKKLSKHMLTHSNTTPLFVCKVCGKGFKDKGILRRHLDVHGEKHICTECGKQLNTRATYNTHMLVHSNKMPHKCEFCGRGFKRAKGLKYHLIAHMGLRPYSCDFCEKTFSTGSSCRLHKKTMHPVELAALEASGVKAYTKNVPSIDELKAVAKTTKNWAPLQSKQNGFINLNNTQESELDKVKVE